MRPPRAHALLSLFLLCPLASHAGYLPGGAMDLRDASKKGDWVVSKKMEVDAVQGTVAIHYDVINRGQASPPLRFAIPMTDDAGYLATGYLTYSLSPEVRNVDLRIKLNGQDVPVDFSLVDPTQKASRAIDAAFTLAFKPQLNTVDITYKFMPGGIALDDGSHFWKFIYPLAQARSWVDSFRKFTCRLTMPPPDAPKDERFPWSLGPVPPQNPCSHSPSWGETISAPGKKTVEGGAYTFVAQDLKPEGLIEMSRGYSGGGLFPDTTECPGQDTPCALASLAKEMKAKRYCGDVVCYSMPNLSAFHANDGETGNRDEIIHGPALPYIRNEIFARHGLMFSKPDFAAFFKQFSWYRPAKESTALNDVEKWNVRFIQELEARQLTSTGDWVTPSDPLRAEMPAACRQQP